MLCWLDKVEKKHGTDGHIYQNMFDVFPKNSTDLTVNSLNPFSETVRVCFLLSKNGSHSPRSTEHVISWRYLQTLFWHVRGMKGSLAGKSVNHFNSFSLPKIQTILTRLFLLSALCCWRSVDWFNHYLFVLSNIRGIFLSLLNI